MAEVSKVIAKGKMVITNDKGERIEIENPELLLVKKEKGK